jgi:NADH-quinone oxidoreductase subunit L
LNKYYFDEAYAVLFIQPYYAICRGWFWFDQHIIDGAVNGVGAFGVAWGKFQRWFDETFVDGAVNGVGWLTRGFGSTMRYLQSGRLQNYAFIVFAALVVLWLLQ